MDNIPPNAMSDDPAELAAMAGLKEYMAGLEPDVRMMIDKFVNCSAAEILEEYFESGLVKALIASSGIIGSKVGPRSKGSGLVWLFHKMGEYDGIFGEWGFHKGGKWRGFTEVLAKAVESFGGDDFNRRRCGNSNLRKLCSHGCPACQRR